MVPKFVSHFLQHEFSPSPTKSHQIPFLKQLVSDYSNAEGKLRARASLQPHYLFPTIQMPSSSSVKRLSNQFRRFLANSKVELHLCLPTLLHSPQFQCYLRAFHQAVNKSQNRHPTIIFTSYPFTTDIGSLTLPTTLCLWKILSRQFGHLAGFRCQDYYRAEFDKPSKFSPFLFIQQHIRLENHYHLPIHNHFSNLQRGVSCECATELSNA